MSSPTRPDSSPGTHVEVQYACEQANLPEREQFVCWALAPLEARFENPALCIRIVNEAEGRALNKRYRDKDCPTNVLSFPADVPVQPEVIGDLVLCAPVIAREAKEQGKALEAHYAHLTVHGVLHCLGHDHQSEADADAMEALECRILQRLGFPDPYETATLDAGQANEDTNQAPR